MTAPGERVAQGVALSRATLARHSKSFALAGRLLPAGCRDAAAVVYAWCRRADDAIDLAPPSAHGAALAALHAELDQVYGADAPDDPLLAAFADVVRRCGIPASYPRELLRGMEMDATGTSYETLEALEHYCFRVAGTVGLMMCHVLGVTSAAALRRAAHLGMAMQLTNICRDVAEDRARGRDYLPRALPAASGAGAERVRSAVAALLARADVLYRSGDAGLAALSLRCAIAIRAARLIYAAIGGEIRSGRCDVLARRAVVAGWRKRLLAARAVWDGLRSLPRRWWPASRPLVRTLPVVRYPDDVAFS